MGVLFSVLLGMVIVGGPIAALAFAPLWVPSLIGMLPGRDPLVAFVRSSMRVAPEDWREDGGYPRRYRHTSGLVIASNGYDEAYVAAPDKVAFGWRDRRRLLGALARWERRQKRLTNNRARIAAIETIVGKKAA